MHEIVQYNLFNRPFILEYDKLQDVKICSFRLESNKEYIPAVNIKIENTWLTILAESEYESKEIEKELRKIIMKRNSKCLRK